MYVRVRWTFQPYHIFHIFAKNLMVVWSFRKRGGSVDNLLDDLGDVTIPEATMTKASKKKSLSSKNLSMTSELSGMKLPPPASSDSEECTRITTVWILSTVIQV